MLSGHICRLAILLKLCITSSYNNKENMAPLCTQPPATTMFKFLNNSFYIDIICEEVLLGKVMMEMNSFFRRAHFLKDVSKFATTTTNYIFRFLFTTWTFHLEGENVFGFAKCSVNFSLDADDKSHRPNHIKFSHPRVVIFVYQLRSINDLSIGGCHVLHIVCFLYFLKVV